MEAQWQTYCDHYLVIASIPPAFLRDFKHAFVHGLQEALHNMSHLNSIEDKDRGALMKLEWFHDVSVTAEEVDRNGAALAQAIMGLKTHLKQQERSDAAANN